MPKVATGELRFTELGAVARITASKPVSMRTSKRDCRTTRFSLDGAWNVASGRMPRGSGENHSIRPRRPVPMGNHPSA